MSSSLTSSQSGLLNRFVERLRVAGLARRLLQRRARAAREGGLPPLVLVPGMLGTRLASPRGRLLWGNLRGLYFGPSFTQGESARQARPAGLLDGLTVVPGLYEYDLYGGLVRFLEAAGGYRVGEELFVLDYDWRQSALAGAERLAQLIDRIRGASHATVDVVSISTGGTVVRTLLAQGCASALRRSVYLGAPQRGSFDALACLHRGFRFAPAGKHFTPIDAALCQPSLESLPHPADPLFVDEEGAPLEHDLYDAALWLKLGLLDELPPRFAQGLALAKQQHERLDAQSNALTAGDATVIGARHLPTPARVLINRRGRAHVPTPRPRPDNPYLGFTYRPGDGELPDSSLRALPGLNPERVWWVTPSAHHKLPADPEVHHLVLEALIATSRPIPERSLDPSRVTPRSYR